MCSHKNQPRDYRVGTFRSTPNLREGNRLEVELITNWRSPVCVNMMGFQRLQAGEHTEVPAAGGGRGVAVPGDGMDV